MAHGGLSPAPASPGVPDHPAYSPLRPLLQRLGPQWMEPKALQDAALGLPSRPCTASGLPLSFAAADCAGAGNYELHIHATGEVPTRAGNAHDAFNALAWLSYPRLKASMNAAHAARITAEGRNRGRLRDLLTLLDESGALVACADPVLADCLREARWAELFWDRREALARGLRVFVVGHATLEKGLAPYPGITCKALIINTSLESLTWPEDLLREWVDGAAADWVGRLSESASPRDLPPLPVYGMPGWLPDSTHRSFYLDTRWFRPARGAAGKLESGA